MCVCDIDTSATCCDKHQTINITTKTLVELRGKNNIIPLQRSAVRAKKPRELFRHHALYGKERNGPPMRNNCRKYSVFPVTIVAFFLGDMINLAAEFLSVRLSAEA
jgi:hypothetical protein